MTNQNEDPQRMIEIDALLKGRLPEPEAASLQREIRQDPDLARQVQRQRLHLEVLDLMLEDDLGAKMNAWEKEAGADPPTSTIRPGWLVAGLLAIGLVAGAYFLRTSHKNEALPVTSIPSKNDTLKQERREMPKNDTIAFPIKSIPNLQPLKKRRLFEAKKLIAESPSLPDAVLKTTDVDLAVILTDQESNRVGRGTVTDSLMTESFQLIREKNYPPALRLLNQAASKTDAGLELACVYFLNRQYAQAQPVFESLANQKGYSGVERAAYYSAICLLASGQKIEAAQRLQEMANDPGHAYSKQALQTLRLIKR